MLTLRYILSLLMVIVVLQTSDAQVEKVEQIVFSQVVKSPIEVEVVKKGDVMEFFAVNKTLFPYQLEISFSIFVNLDGPSSYSDIIGHGRNRLFSLRIRDKSTNPNYQYSFRYKMGDPRKEADIDFPYLIPFSGNHVTPSRQFIRYFEVTEGDSVVAPRKGIVTSVPESEQEGNKLFDNTLEILHADGSVAIFKNLKKEFLKVKEGDKVYPGQQVATIPQEMIVGVLLYRFSADGRANAFDNKYVVSEDNIVESTKIKTTDFDHPISIISKELNKREVKKLQSGTLYDY